MLFLDKNRRPNCEEILNEKEKWRLNLDLIRENTRQLNKESFEYRFIETKLKFVNKYVKEFESMKKLKEPKEIEFKSSNDFFNPFEGITYMNFHLIKSKTKKENILKTQIREPPKQIWLPAVRGKGLEITGTFTRRNGHIFMEMTFSNKAMQAMDGFAVQFSKNSFGLAPAQPLQVPTPLHPNVSSDISLQLNTMCTVQKMKPLTSLKVAIKNNVDVFYFNCIVPTHVFCVEDGAMDKRVFLATWKDIPSQNEVQYVLENVTPNVGQISQKLQANNVFTIAKRNVEGQDMLYQSLKLTNNIWVLAELKVQPGVHKFTLSLKSRAMSVVPSVYQIYLRILHK
jgi:hypothetical protein